MDSQRIAIEVEGVHKSYRVPVHRIETFKERALHPFRSVEYSELRALEDVSFDIKAGEFFGIAGRNGSGKTTLLKLLASIYASDRGKIRMAGRVAPFIELGVGFNPDLAARDNIMLNGVMMGLTSREAEARSDRVIEFAELEDFTEMKLKNYSSGMRVRLGFAMLVEADADILLIDEVLAVGDAAFQQKCTDTFHEFKREGRTIVLVTHAMDKLTEYCDRAALLHEARLVCLGHPGEVGNRYLELNFSHADRVSDADAPAEHPRGSAMARIVDFWLEDESGQRTESFKHGEPIRFCASIEARARVEGLGFGMQTHHPSGANVFQIPIRNLADHMDGDGVVHPGESIKLRGSVENPLASGRYVIHAGLTRNQSFEDVVSVLSPAASFVVFGSDSPDYSGLVSLAHEITVERDPARKSASGRIGGGVAAMTGSGRDPGVGRGPTQTTE